MAVTSAISVKGPIGKLLLVSMVLLIAGVQYSHAASAYYVTPTGSGSENGIDWNNAYAGFGTAGGQANPSSMSRGATYYVAGGGPYSGKTFSHLDHRRNRSEPRHGRRMEQLEFSISG